MELGIGIGNVTTFADDFLFLDALLSVLLLFVIECNHLMV